MQPAQPLNPDGTLPFGPDTGIIEGILAGLELPPIQSPSEWAAENFVLSSEGSAEPGQFNPWRAAYQPGMMDAAFEPGIKIVTMKTSAQVGKTTVLLVIIGYAAHRHPAPMLLVQPTQEMAKAFSEERLGPAIRDVPVLTKTFPAGRSRGSGNTMFYKKFPGGYIALVGANNPVKLRMRAVKYGFADEVDAYEGTATKEGDPVELLQKRFTTFWDSKLLQSSTPLIKHKSRISRAYEDSDQRVYMLPCPHCHEFQHLEWRIDADGGEQGLKPLNIHWEKGKPDTAWYECAHHGCVMSDLDIKAAVREGYWQAQRPEVNGHAGFWIWELYSPWSSLSEIVKAFEKAEGYADRLQTFVNTTLGLEWSGNVIGAVKVEELLARREEYEPYVLPDRAGLLTAAVDTQHDRLELQVTAWGLNDERWLLTHEQIMGDPNSPQVWEQLKEQLNRRYPTKYGHDVGIEVAALDSGGMHTQKVYDFCALHLLTAGKLWWPIKGVAGMGVPIWKRSEQSIRTGVKLILVGVDDAKIGVYSALGIRDRDKPNYVHLPTRLEREHMESLTAEKLIQVTDEKGFPKIEWHKPEGKRNEVLDCAGYNLAARRSLNVDMGARLERLSKPPAPAIDAAEIAKLFKF